MKRSEIKSGMVLEVYEEGDIDKYLAVEINDEITLMNQKYSLGELDYWFDEDLNDNEPDQVNLLNVYKLNTCEFTIWKSMEMDECLELIYEKQINNDELEYILTKLKEDYGNDLIGILSSLL